MRELKHCVEGPSVSARSNQRLLGWLVADACGAQVVMEPDLARTVGKRLEAQADRVYDQCEKAIDYALHNRNIAHADGAWTGQGIRLQPGEVSTARAAGQAGRHHTRREGGASAPTDRGVHWVSRAAGPDGSGARGSRTHTARHARVAAARSRTADAGSCRCAARTAAILQLHQELIETRQELENVRKHARDEVQDEAFAAVSRVFRQEAQDARKLTDVVRMLQQALGQAHASIEWGCASAMDIFASG